MLDDDRKMKKLMFRCLFSREQDFGQGSESEIERKLALLEGVLAI